MKMEFLSDVTVIELSEHISASACTKTMAALGARVIKIEAPAVATPRGEWDLSLKTIPIRRRADSFSI